MAYTTQLFSAFGGLTMAAKNDALFLLMFAIIVAVGTFLFIKHEEKKQFETELRRRAQRKR